jgi:ABC-2 type transport system ATP-binding protein
MPAWCRCAAKCYGSAVILQVDELNKHYGRYHALRNVSLKLEGEARSIGLLGPNGAGKSTLLKVLLGLLPFEGAVSVLGIDVKRTPFQVRAQIGYMPERDCHLPGMNAVELCSYGAELSGLPRAEAMERAHAVLDFVSFADKRYQAVDGYSTGMKQKVKLAQALVHDPKLVLLDEPTNGLDPSGREEMLQLVRSLPSRSGCSVMLSSHLLPDVEQVCDQAILLHQGEVLFSGEIDQLRRQGQEDVYEVRVKSEDEKLFSALTARGCKVERDGAMLAVRLPVGADAQLIFETAADEKLQVRHLTPRRLTLESAFMKAIEGRS